MKRIIIATLTVAAAFISTMAHGHYQSQEEQDTEAAITRAITVPLMLPAGSEYGQSFVRVGVGSAEFDTVDVHIRAFDDSGLATGLVSVQLAPYQSFHFNSDDLTDGNAAKGIEGIGPPRQGVWRLHVQAYEADIKVSSYVRTRDGFLTSTGDYTLLPADINTFNPASNTRQQSRLRLINFGHEATTVRIVGFDDDAEDNAYGPVLLTLPAGHARTLTAVDLEEGAEGLEGALGDGTGKWSLSMHGNQFSRVVVQNLLYASSGHISNLGTSGHRAEDDVGDEPTTAVTVPLNLDVGLLHNAVVEFTPGDVDWYRYRLSEPGWLGLALLADDSDIDSLNSAALYDEEGERLTNVPISLFGTYQNVGEGDYFLGVDATGELEATVFADFIPRTDRHGDTRENAANLALSPPISYGEDGGVWGAINADGDVDWFRIAVTEAGNLNLEVRAKGGIRPRFLFKLYDDAGSELASQNLATANSLALDVAEGTYYVSIEVEEGSTYEIGAYGISVNVY